MVAGHLQLKSGYWYLVLTFKENGKPKSKWISTGLKEKGNKRKAEEFLLKARMDFENEDQNSRSEEDNNEDLTLVRLIDMYMKQKKWKVKETTYQGYASVVNTHLKPYAIEHPINVKDIGVRYCQMYIDYVYSCGKSHKTVQNHKAIINNILNYAVALEEINSNPMTKIKNPPKGQPIENYFDADELKRLLEAVKGTILEYPVWMAAIYGLRRSEVIGLKWDAIDFKNGLFTVKHVVVVANPDGEHRYASKGRNSTKTNSAKTFPLLPDIIHMLQNIKDKQLKNGTYKNDGYVYAGKNGNAKSPNYLTNLFSRFLKENGFRHIRYHDLRHSCASALITDENRNVSLKDIQYWLGHSNIQSTMRYAHLSAAVSKKHTAGVIGSILEVDGKNKR